MFLLKYAAFSPVQSLNIHCMWCTVDREEGNVLDVSVHCTVHVYYDIGNGWWVWCVAKWMAGNG